MLASHLGIDDTFIDCKTTTDLASVLQLIQIIGFNPQADELIGAQRRALMVALKKSQQPHLLIFDALDSAQKEVNEWLVNDILSRLRYYPGLIVCICSKEPMQYSKTVWGDKAVAFELKPILDPGAWLSICEKDPDASPGFIENLLKFTLGQPKLTSEVLLKNHGLASSSSDWSQR
jgi:hypothetical protein